MGVIANLIVTLTGNNEGLSRSLKKSREDVGFFEKTVDSSAKKINGYLTGIGASLLAGSAVRGLRETIGQLDDLGDSAARLGVNVGKLGGLTHAAFMSDVSSDGLVNALTKMEKNVASGNKAFEGMGLNVSKLKQLDAAEMFIQIADAINKMETPAEKTAAAMAVFGKSGASMLELISKGRSGIEAAMSEAERMGLAPSEEDMKRIQEAEDAIKRMTEAFKGLKQASASAFSGIAKDAADMISGTMGGSTPADNAWRSNVQMMSGQQFTEFVSNYEASGKYNSFVEKAISERQKQEGERMRKQAEDSKFGNRIFAGGRTLVGGVADSARGFGSGVMDSVSSSAPAWLYRNNPEAFWNNILGGGKNNAIGDMQQQMAMSFAMTPFMGQAPNEFAGQQDKLDSISKRAKSLMKEAGDFHPGGAALEKGSAAAFSQGARSQQFSQHTKLLHDQLSELKQLKEAVKANKPQVVPVVSIT